MDGLYGFISFLRALFRYMNLVFHSPKYELTPEGCFMILSQILRVMEPWEVCHLSNLIPHLRKRKLRSRDLYLCDQDHVTD